MPLQSKPLIKRWPTLDLPILPFLAPRVFAPWPSYARRAHSISQTRTDEGQELRKPKEYRNASKEVPVARRVEGRVTKPEGKHMQDGKPTSNSLGPEDGEDRTEFWRKYSEIWEDNSKHPFPLEPPLDSQSFASGRDTIDGKEAVGTSDTVEDLGKILEDLGLASIDDKPGARKTEEQRSWLKPVNSSGLREQIGHKPIAHELRPDRSDKRDAEKWYIRSSHESHGGLHRVAIKPTARARYQSRTRERLESKILQFGMKSDTSSLINYLVRYKERLDWKRKYLLGWITRRIRAAGLPKDKTWTDKRLTQISNDWASEFSSAWNTSYAILRFNQKKTNFARLSTRVLIDSVDPLVRTIHKMMRTGNSPADLQRIWGQLPVPLRVAIWPELMNFSLLGPPVEALKLLVATCVEPYPPAYAIEDSLTHILSSHLGHSTSPDPKVTRAIYQSATTLREMAPKGYLTFTQDFIHSLLTQLQPSELKLFYERLAEINQPLSRNTLMHFASFFAKHDQVNLSVKILQRMKHEDMDFAGPEMASVCTTIFNAKSLDISSELELLEFMLDGGLEPNIFHHNVLIRSFGRQGNHELAWRLYDNMTAKGIEPSAHTYVALIQNSKNAGNREAIYKLWTEIQSKGLRDRFIVTEILHAILTFDMDKRPTGVFKGSGNRSTFGMMLQIYCDYFRLEPLAHIAPVYMEAWPDLPRPSQKQSSLEEVTHNGEVQDKANADVDERLMNPEPVTLAVMMAALVRDLPNPPRDNRPFDLRPYATQPFTLRFYRHFHSLVLAGDPAVAGLCQDPRIYNLALIGLGRSHTTLRYCTEVIGSMLVQKRENPEAISNASQLDSSAGSSHTGNDRGQNRQNASNKEYHICSNVGNPPSGQELPLIKLSSIRHRGVSTERVHISPPAPNDWTWNILLKCFLDRNQPRAADKVLQMMKTRGVTPTHHTWQSLITAYSRAQQVSSAIDAVDRMEHAGFESDEITVKSLNWIRDRNAVIQAMQPTEKARRWREKALFEQPHEQEYGSGQAISEQPDTDGNSFPAQDDPVMSNENGADEDKTPLLIRYTPSTDKKAPPSGLVCLYCHKPGHKSKYCVQRLMDVQKEHRVQSEGEASQAILERDAHASVG
ncbi:hypothetical protein BP6252_12329 [Coleophoma cylindrospora]|uniref:CCHC-type domain-containing protein n=1 Tax=Coleophoma cylindrospora TaxID=1849047 RepID=A0A3D8QGH6_9HELO|nr:hypothetical protein BP6252_12329 [Coleophoma cylindrospora]